MVIILAIILILFNLRNCDRQDWTQLINSNFIQYQTIEGELCLDGFYEDYIPKTAFIHSMGLQVKDNIWIRDSDFDGINDNEEKAAKLNPFGSRSTEKTLDHLCNQYLKPEQCFKFNENLNCKNKPLFYGFSDCDQEFLQSISKNSLEFKSVDSDEDGVLDYIEILNGLNPHFKNQEQEFINLSMREKTPFYYLNLDFLFRNSSDSVDGKLINAESTQQQKPQKNKKLLLSLKSENTKNCSSTSIKIKIQNIPWFLSKIPIVEPRNNVDPILSLNSLQNESFALFILKMDPKELTQITENKNKSIYLLLKIKLKMDSEEKLTFTQSDFVVL